MPLLSVYLLGAPRLEIDSQPIQIKRKKDLALLAYLAVTAKAHTREKLATLFWPEKAPNKSLANLRRSIWELKNITGDSLLVAERSTVYLQEQGALWLDVASFRSYVTKGRNITITTKALEQFVKATELYQDDFMAGFNLPDSLEFDEWQYFHMIELRQDLEYSLVAIATHYEQRADYEAAIPYAQRWLALDQLNESAQRLLMKLYTWSGKRIKAIQQYHQCVQVLEDQLGLPPDEETTSLYEQIQAGELDKQGLVRKKLFQPTSNLPTALTPFVGRQPELELIREHLQNPDCQLLTLTGPGGIGKTRLAIQAARRLEVNFRHGVIFVPMSALISRRSILPAIAGTLGLSTQTQELSIEKQLYDYLRNKHMLLIIDNFEQLSENAGLLKNICIQAEHVKMLVTSRERLNIQGEWTLSVGGMHYPGDKRHESQPELSQFQEQDIEEIIQENSAVQLFVQSATRAQLDFQVSAENYPAVIRITQLVQGMPLALELAAAWLTVLTCEEIAIEIESDLDILETSMRDIPTRQRSMRAVFQHSWELLSPRERKIFSRLSVFQAGFNQQSSHDIYGISLQDIRKLIDKSFLLHAPDGRYYLHELLHQYAAEKLAEDPATHLDSNEKHSAYYSSRLEVWGEMLKGPKYQEALSQISLDLDNCLSAWNWAVENRDGVRLNQASECLCLFYWRQTRYEEGLEITKAAIDALGQGNSSEELRLLARLIAWQGHFNFNAANKHFKKAELLFQQSLSILEKPELDQHQTQAEKALALMGHGDMAFIQGHGHEALELYGQSLDLYQEVGDKYWTSEALYYLGLVYAYLIWDAGRAQAYWQMSLDIKKALGDTFSIAKILFEMGVVSAYHNGNIEAGIRNFQESYDYFTQMESLVSKAKSLDCLVHIADLTPDAKRDEIFRRQISVYEELGYLNKVASTKALIYMDLGKYILAEEQLQQVLENLQTYSEQGVEKPIIRWNLGYIKIVVGKPEQAKDIFTTEIKAMRKNTAKHMLGRNLGNLSLTEFKLGERENAWKHALESLKLLLEYRHYDFLVHTLATMSMLLADDGETEQAIKLYGLLTAYPKAANLRWFEDLYWTHINEVMDNLPDETVASAIKRGRGQDIWETTEELLQTYQEYGSISNHGSTPGILDDQPAEMVY